MAVWDEGVRSRAVHRRSAGPARGKADVEFEDNWLVSALKAIPSWRVLFSSPEDVLLFILFVAFVAFAIRWALMIIG